MKKWGMALCAPGWFCLFAALLLMVVVNCGTNDGIYRELQEANGLPEAAGVTEEEMERLDGMLADYLAGDEAALDASPFNEKELAHMRDVLGLFDLARAVRNALLVIAVAFLAAGLWLSRGRGFCRCALWGWRRCFCRWAPSPFGRRRTFPALSPSFIKRCSPTTSGC